jgi:DNA phosphorothioation-dependent restriction protein DptH
MPAKITNGQRTATLRLLAEGHDRETIASKLGLTVAQVSAVKAHVTMQKYRLPSIRTASAPLPDSRPCSTEPQKGQDSARLAIPLGKDLTNDTQVFWNLDPEKGVPNPHVLVLGESGYGKTYAILCIIAELTRRRIPCLIFDYGQGFSRQSLTSQFVNAVAPLEIEASRDGIDINPLQVFGNDVHGPINVAQRIADTFARVYSRIGVQQHATLRRAVLEVMSEYGISADEAGSWNRELPPFKELHRKLESYAQEDGTQARVASLVGSHISTMFVFNTFRASGRRLDWQQLLSSRNHMVTLQLKGLEHSLERAVTEFLLWNFLAYIEALGPSSLRCFVILDEAHKLCFDVGSPVEKLLREGRKYGLGLILASQQPEDFSAVAFANTATKLVFQITDEQYRVSRLLHRKVENGPVPARLAATLSKLPRGTAYVVTQNCGSIVRISPLHERLNN